MELLTQSHHFTHRMPDWRAAAIAGFAAGVVFLFVEMIALWLMGESPWGPPGMMAAIVLGRDTVSEAPLDAGTILAALIVHFGLSVVFGFILAVIMTSFRLDSSLGMASLAGAVFGLVVYWINFHGMTQVFPWFAEARGALTLLSHVVFGLVAAVYMTLEAEIDGPRGADFTG